MGAHFELMLYLVGLGLGNERDVTLRGLDAVRSCAKVYLEAYTSVLGVDVDALERLYGKPVTTCDRRFVEEGVDAAYEITKLMPLLNDMNELTGYIKGNLSITVQAMVNSPVLQGGLIGRR